MKITFEGTGIQDIYDQMEALLASTNMSRRIKASMVEEAKKLPAFKDIPGASMQGPGPDVFGELEDLPVDKPVDKPVDISPEKAEMKERMAKMRAKRDANKAAKAAAAAAPAEAPVDKPAPKAAKAKAAEPVDPAEMVKIRQKTIADLQDAYANGHQAEVFELLSRFGNGAKSFRELPPDAFVPISEAIAKGALT